MTELGLEPRTSNLCSKHPLTMSPRWLEKAGLQLTTVAHDHCIGRSLPPSPSRDGKHSERYIPPGVATCLIPSWCLLKPLASIIFHDQQVTQINYLLGKEGLSFYLFESSHLLISRIGLINSREGQRKWLP